MVINCVIMKRSAFMVAALLYSIYEHNIYYTEVAKLRFVSYLGSPVSIRELARAQ